MTAAFVLVALVLLAALEGGLVYALVVDAAVPHVKEWLRRREVVRRSAIDQEMQAARAAQQLSLLAWKARHEMYDLATHEPDPQSFGHLAKRK
jgi:hypothetical protein